MINFSLYLNDKFFPHSFSLSHSSSPTHICDNHRRSTKTTIDEQDVAVNHHSYPGTYHRRLTLNRNHWPQSQNTTSTREEREEISYFILLRGSVGEDFFWISSLFWCKYKDGEAVGVALILWKDMTKPTRKTRFNNLWSLAQSWSGMGCISYGSAHAKTHACKNW